LDKKDAARLRRPRYSALLEIGGKKGERPDCSLMDLKEAAQTAVPRAAHVRAPQ
jgi:hypothetical protein